MNERINGLVMRSPTSRWRDNQVPRGRSPCWCSIPRVVHSTLPVNSSGKWKMRRFYKISVQLHVGVHVGQITMRANDVHGQAVHVAARVSALAGPGEVLCSSAVRDAVASATEFSFGSPRTVALRGVASLYDVVRLLESDAPPRHIPRF